MRVVPTGPIVVAQVVRESILINDVFLLNEDDGEVDLVSRKSYWSSLSFSLTIELNWL